MPLNQVHINKLKEIYQRHYGAQLSDGEAWQMGAALIELYALLALNAQKERKVRTSIDLPQFPPA